MNGDPIPVEFIAWLRPVNLVRFCIASAKQLPCRYCGGREKLGSGICPSLDWSVSISDDHIYYCLALMAHTARFSIVRIIDYYYYYM